jgi:hypothetical protein
MVYIVTNFIIIWYYIICKWWEFLNRRSQTSVNNIISKKDLTFQTKNILFVKKTVPLLNYF